MVALSNSAEGGTNGVTVTTGNSGATSGNAWNTVTIGASATLTFDNTHPAAATALDYSFTTPVGAVTDFLQWGSASITGAPLTFWARGYVYRAATPPSTWQFLKFLGGAGAIGSVRILNAGPNELAIADSAGTVQFTSGANAVPNAAIWRWETMVTVDAAVGAIQVKIFSSNPQHTNPDAVYKATNINTGTSGVTTMQVGPSLAIASDAAFIDEIAYSDVGWIGPSGTPVPNPSGGTAAALITANTPRF